MTGFRASPVAGLNTEQSEQSEHIKEDRWLVYSALYRTGDRKGSGVNTNGKMLTMFIVVGGWWQPCSRSDGSIPTIK